MCKVAALPKVPQDKIDLAWLFMITLGDVISDYNDDGLGYAAFDKADQIFGEKWLVNSHSFRHDIPFTEKSYAKFGPVNRDNAQAIILHTRAGTTGGIRIQNTHPFVNNEDNVTSAIIHNGFINNHMQLEKKYSTCDSEVIVHLYDQLKVATDFNQIKELMSAISGWYTVLAVSKDENNTPVIDMFTDGPRLGSFFVPELDTRVYSTQLADIKRVADTLGLTVKDPELLKPYHAKRLNALTGEVMSHLEYTYDDVPEDKPLRKAYMAYVEAKTE